MSVVVKKTVTVEIESALVTEFARELKPGRNDVQAIMVDGKTVRLEFASGTEFVFKQDIKVNVPQ